MFESLGDRLQSAVNKIKGYGKITEDNISEVTREIRLALLEADVNYKVVKEFINNVKEKALGEEVAKSLYHLLLLYKKKTSFVYLFLILLLILSKVLIL